MSENTVQQEDLAKALRALQDIAKGHSSRGTVSTEVESMKDGSMGAGSDAGSTQVHHTPDNSDRSTWAGSTWSGVADNGPGVDSVSENGTDYQAQGKVMKSILEKLAKGQQLTASEFAILKGSMPFDKYDDDKDDKDDDKEVSKAKSDKDEDEDMDKSLTDFATEDDSVSKGLEVSEFLAGFAGVVAKSLEAMERRIVKQVLAAQTGEAQADGEFQKSLAEAIVNLGEAVTAVAQRQEQLESAPARAPRAAQPGQVQVLEKGNFQGQAPGQGEALTKSLVAATLVDLVQKGEASAQDVIKFDSSGTLSPELEAKVRAAAGR